MNLYEIITKKKEGRALTSDEIAYFVRGVTEGSIPDYQTAALLMAICLRGMNGEETALLTDAMMRSGEVLDLSELGEGTVDKHSTGGVGDKTTLILGPIVAACGGVLAKMSGRGLGHTGGTVDKLESIPGFQITLSPEDFFSVAKKTGLCVIGQSAALAPADKKLYALRDVTATVDSIPLIASSILSKKLACGAKSIVLDVKYGSGAFMKTPDDARSLAAEMVRIGKSLGRRVSAFVTDMDQPLGNFIGNALEVKEAVMVLQGKENSALREICLSLAGEMLSLSLSLSPEEGRKKAEAALSSGAALAKMKAWLRAQGGDVAFLSDLSLLPAAPWVFPVCAPESGYLFAMDTEKIGLAALELGAGRRTKSDPIDLAAGIQLKKKKGDFAEKGETLCLLHASDPTLFDAAEQRFLSALTFSRERAPENAVIYEKIS